MKTDAGQKYLIGESAQAEALKELIHETSGAFERLVGEPPPPGLILVIDTEEQIPIASAYDWYSTAMNASAVALANPIPSEDEIRELWRTEISEEVSFNFDEGADLEALMHSQRYWVVQRPFAMRASLFSDLLGLPSDLAGDMEWGLFAASDGLSDNLADALVTVGMAAYGPSLAEQMVLNLFPGRARSGVLRRARATMQAELFGTWLCLQGAEFSLGAKLLGDYIAELNQD